MSHASQAGFGKIPGGQSGVWTQTIGCTLQSEFPPLQFSVTPSCELPLSENFFPPSTSLHVLVWDGPNTPKPQYS